MTCKRAVVNKKAVWIGDWRRRHMQLDAAQGILSFSTIYNELRSVTHLAKMEWLKYLRDVIDARAVEECAGSTEELEKQAVVELYDATEGPNWSRNNNWLTSKPIAEWDGITVDSAGRVIELSLGMNNLKGTLPNSIGALTNLTVLHLHWNELEGVLPNGIGRLCNLETLSLDTNKFTGDVPKSWGALEKLRELNICQNKLKGGIEHIRGLEQLCDMVMDACLVEQLRLPAEIAAFVTDYYGARRLAGPDVQTVLEYIDDRLGSRGVTDAI